MGGPYGRGIRGIAPPHYVQYTVIVQVFHAVCTQTRAVYVGREAEEEEGEEGEGWEEWEGDFTYYSNKHRYTFLLQ